MEKKKGCVLMAAEWSKGGSFAVGEQTSNLQFCPVRLLSRRRLLERHDGGLLGSGWRWTAFVRHGWLE